MVASEAKEPLSTIATIAEPTAGVKRIRAPNGTFDRTAYQRELMRKRRLEVKARKTSDE